mmetsp:Transcript_30968/g.99906  ORF Transcript_30968/g.99906 Transcript_30968/m.99906 type:complete len:741 (-) Transcript_30968:384-2606(-)
MRIAMNFVVAGLLRHKRGGTCPPFATKPLLGDEENQLVSLEGDLEALALGSQSKLRGFFDETLRSFAVEVGVGRFSVTSTAYAADALAVAGDEEMVEGVAAALLDAEWRDGDLFQLPLLAHASVELAKKRPTSRIELLERLSKLAEATDLMVASRARMTDSYRQQLSCYLQFWLAKALLSLVDLAFEEEAVRGSIIATSKTARPLAKALARAHEVARNEVCRQIAYDAAGDASGFDVVRLAYSLLAYACVGRAKDNVVTLWQKSTSDRTSSQDDQDQDQDDQDDSQKRRDFSMPGGPEEIQVNDKLVARALKALFDAQHDDGLWPAGQAIYARSRRGFDLGNAFVFAPDLAASLLRFLEPEQLRPYVANFGRLAKWCLENDIDGKGWRSSHLETTRGPPLAWATAQVVAFAYSGLRVARCLLTDDVIAEFEGDPKRPPNSLRFDGLLDSDLGAAATKSKSLKSVLAERFLAPEGPLAYSAVIFGPPGTAKTTTAKAVAEALGYGFVVVDTSTFLAAGMPNVFSRVAYVFGRLKKLQDTVVLFDEVEEFCLDRRGDLATKSVESRMLTTALLTQLNDLRQARRCIFFVATNRLDDFDSAIVRPGRIDLLLFVGTPSLPARVQRFRDKLLFKKRCLVPVLGGGTTTTTTATTAMTTTATASSQAEEAVVAAFRDFLEAHWESDLQFFNFMESERFADTAADALLASHSADLAPILADHRTTIVLRDPQSQAEYISDRLSTRL